MTFTDFEFDPRTQEGIDAMGYVHPTPIQQQVIPAVIAGRDVMATAQTGTGKTAAYLLPVIDGIVKTDDADHHIKALIIVPTRELALQIDQQAVGMSFFCGLSSAAIYGGGEGVDWDRQKRAIMQGTDIIVATPGRILSHLRLGYVDFSKLKYFILDEADRMLDMGFHEDIMDILSYIQGSRQTLMFSATMPSEIRSLASKLLQNPAEISIALSKPAEGVLQAAYAIDDAQKLKLLTHLIQNRDLTSILVFSATKRAVKEISQLLNKTGMLVRAIHSDLEQREREDVLLSFRNRQTQVLVATDVLSRGIDIEGIDLVLNYDVPQDAEDYIHRVGRTARAEATGLAITFVNPKDSHAFRRIEQLMEQKVRMLPLPEGFSPVALPDGSRKRSGGQHSFKRRPASGKNNQGRNRSGRRSTGGNQKNSN
ncbi:MAG TPA: DEAD/DEAH box helicase [Bacteroidales bacterium]|nr:DEAD/DEAH box helicase [Bacteroidales bacterium]